jgi:dolichyl-phosphate beta-glucosyltransferase
MISVIIAAFNEEKRLPGTLIKIESFLESLEMEHEIIIVDDGSTDLTSAVSRTLSYRIKNLSVIRYENNMGKGYALRTGVAASRGNLVLVSDADLSTPIEEMLLLLPQITENRYHAAIGSRALAESNIIKKQPWWRQEMGRIFNRFVHLIVLDSFSDTQCGFKLFDGNTARRLLREAHINRFAYDVEILALALSRGCKVCEVPIRWINSPGSKVHPIRDSLQMLKDLVKIRFTVGYVHKNMPVAEKQIAAAIPVVASFNDRRLHTINRRVHKAH